MANEVGKDRPATVHAKYAYSFLIIQSYSYSYTFTFSYFYLAFSHLNLCSDPKRQFELQQLRNTLSSWHTHIATDNGIFYSSPPSLPLSCPPSLFSPLLSSPLLSSPLFLTLCKAAYRKKKIASSTCSPLERWHAQLCDVINTCNLATQGKSKEVGEGGMKG